MSAAPDRLTVALTLIQAGSQDGYRLLLDLVEDAQIVASRRSH